MWHALLGRLADIAIAFLKVQVEAGAAAIQLFDSWVGAVSPEDYRHAILPHTSRIFAALADSGVPRIHFGVGTGELLGLLGDAGADVVGVDWRVPLGEAARRAPAGKALQGNLDRAILLAPWDGGVPCPLSWPARTTGGTSSTSSRRPAGDQPVSCRPDGPRARGDVNPPFLSHHYRGSAGPGQPTVPPARVPRPS
jgi:hypothetical protein